MVLRFFSNSHILSSKYWHVRREKAQHVMVVGFASNLKQKKNLCIDEVRIHKERTIMFNKKKIKLRKRERKKEREKEITSPQTRTSLPHTSVFTADGMGRVIHLFCELLWPIALCRLY